jgi:hypothetical protein
MPARIHFSNAPAVRCNGRRLGALLSKIVSERASNADERAALVKLLADAATITPATVENLIAGLVDLPPNSWLEKWSVLLDVPTWVLAGTAGRDTDQFIASLEPESSVETIANAAVSVVNCARSDPADALYRAAHAGATRALEQVFGPAPAEDGGLRAMLDAAAGAVH